jgi:hypothetical protein
VLLAYDGGGPPPTNCLAYDIACTAGIVPHFFTIPEVPEEKVPNIVEDARRWIEVEKKRLFLYHLDKGSKEDVRGRRALHRLFNLHPIASHIEYRPRITVTVWRIQSVVSGKAQP